MEIATMPEEIASQREARRDVFKNIVFILVTVGIAYGLITSVGISDLDRIIERSGIWGPLVIIVLKMATIVIVPLPGGPVYAIAGAVFGFWQGLVLTFIGDVLGFSVSFYLSRIFGKKIMNVFVPSTQFPFIEKFLAQGSVPKSFLKARLAFGGFPEVFAYAAGLTEISFLMFIVAQMVLHVPFSALVVLFGNALLAGDPVFFVGGTVVAILFAMIGGWWFKRDFIHES